MVPKAKPKAQPKGFERRAEEREFGPPREMHKIMESPKESEVPFHPIETSKPIFAKGAGLKAVAERFKENKKEMEVPFRTNPFSNPMIEKMEKALRRRPPRKF